MLALALPVLVLVLGDQRGPAPEVSGGATDHASRDSVEPTVASARRSHVSTIAAAEVQTVDGPQPSAMLRPPVDLAAYRRATELRRGGLLAVGAGVLLGTGGVVLATLSPCAPRAGNSCSPAAKWRAVATISIPSAALLIGGAAMLTVGSIRMRRARLSVAWSPSWYGGGFMLRGSF